MANPQNLKPFTGADDPRRMNGKPKGTKHLSTWIQELMNDEEFETYVQDAKEGWKPYKGAPVKAIVRVAMLKALSGDNKWAEWIGKFGYGSKLDVTSNGNTVNGLSDLSDEELNGRIEEVLKRRQK